MSTTTAVTQKDLHDLLEIFEKKSYDAGSCEEGSPEHDITTKCENLFKQDYTLSELDNSIGILSPRYPSRIFIPEHERGHVASSPNLFNLSIDNATPEIITISNSPNQNSPSSAECSTTQLTNTAVSNTFTTLTSTTTLHQTQQQQPQQPQSSTASSSAAPSETIYEDVCDINKVRELVSMAKYARCRQRFVAPVIMYRGKYICRSATISINAETYGRKVVNYAYDCLIGTNYSERPNYVVDNENNESEDSLMNQPSPFTYEEVIKSDIQLLNILNVSTIIDLMVENRKIKYFMAVSSSEKADPENHYKNFNLLALPYPGCEFFKKFRDNNYMAKNLYYDWNQSFNDANICLPKLGPTTKLDINWNDYKNWDLVLMTQNYLKACLKYIQEETSGLLIHCISGWDRTPLFISLVRLSLWADGLIHQSLNALQITYFTVAYDWYLFGHQLPERNRRGEDIMFFCFHVLKFFIDEEFSIVEHRKRTKTSSSSGSSSSIIVLKSDICDDEPLKEDSILVCDQDSNDIFFNSSNCDISITDNFFTTATTTTPQDVCNNIAENTPKKHRSPNPKRSKTSPITVPGASATRQRQESSSSSSSNESWQVVTETGSLDSTTSSSSMMRSPTQQDSGDSSVLNAPTSSINSRDNLPPLKPSALARKQRLSAVRTIFIQAYGKVVGLKFKEGSTMNLVTFVGNLNHLL